MVNCLSVCNNSVEVVPLYKLILVLKRDGLSTVKLLLKLPMLIAPPFIFVTVPVVLEPKFIIPLLVVRVV